MLDTTEYCLPATSRASSRHHDESMAMALRLYTYFRSSASYRVRIALNLKGLAHQAIPIHLMRDGGEHTRPEYRAINPQAMVPTLEADGAALTQSLAIIEWLEETFPTPALLPVGPISRARVRAFALAIACEVAPLGALSVRGYLADVLELTGTSQRAWHHHWIGRGFAACEAMLANSSGPFCFGETPTLADVVLVPQLYNARRFEMEVAAFPKLVRAEAAMLALPAVRSAMPESQPDAD